MMHRLTGMLMLLIAAAISLQLPGALAATCPASNFCSGKTGIFANPCDANCASFIQCAGGTAYVTPCASGLRFNPNSKVCDYKANVACSGTTQSPLPTPSPAKTPATSPSSVNKCDKCNLPTTQGGCKCDSNCDCIVDKCAKCNLPTTQGGCKCDSNCDCVSSGGCPAGWAPAVGTLYDSWPKAGTKECVDYSGCKYAGQFDSINLGNPPNCLNGAQYLASGTGAKDCRIPESTVKTWHVAATYMKYPALLGKKVEVMVEGTPSKTISVNVIDVCNDADCANCCSKNTNSGQWTLLDLEKWSAYDLLGGFNPSASNFDINDVPNNAAYKSAGNKRAGQDAPNALPLCYRVLGKCEVNQSSKCV